MARIPSKLKAALRPVTIVGGHYGVGKTNFAVNLALTAAAELVPASAGNGCSAVTLVDLDVVNPYFRASEQREALEQAGVRLIAPVFAERGSSLDAPSLTAQIEPALEDASARSRSESGCESMQNGLRSLVIVDAGGDDVGATALGRFARVVGQGNYAMLYVVNACRPEVHTVHDVLQNLQDIQRAAHLSATGVVDNTHLKGETTAEVLQSSYELCRGLCSSSKLPLVCKTVPANLQELDKLTLDTEQGKSAPSAFVKSGELSDLLFPVDTMVKNPWE